MSKLTEQQKHFLQAYYKASFTSQPCDWHYAAMIAKQMFNAECQQALRSEEEEIYQSLKLKYEG